MKTAIKPLTQRPAWKALGAHHQKIRSLHLRQLFAADPKRGERLTQEAAGLFLDYSKNRVTNETLQLLLRLADESGLKARIKAMFSGQKINITENRAVLHVALRAPEGERIEADGVDVVPAVHAVLAKMGDFADRVRILYGGSVKADNAASLLGQEDVDGVLVGGASLEADGFLAIARAAIDAGK